LTVNDGFKVKDKDFLGKASYVFNSKHQFGEHIELPLQARALGKKKELVTGTITFSIQYEGDKSRPVSARFAEEMSEKSKKGEASRSFFGRGN